MKMSTVDIRAGASVGSRRSSSTTPRWARVRRLESLSLVMKGEQLAVARLVRHPGGERRLRTLRRRGAPRVTVHVLQLDLQPDGRSGESGLSLTELRHAAGIAHAERRRSFLASHRALRQVLAAELGCPPLSLRFDTGPAGKPSVAGHLLHFSLARRQHLCAIATSRDVEVGVDLELVDPSAAHDVLADQVLPPSARALVRAAPGPARPAVFAVEWTRVEASVKACGASLDDAADCQAAAPASARRLGDLAVSVAARTPRPVDVTWVVPWGTSRHLPHLWPATSTIGAAR